MPKKISIRLSRPTWNPCVITPIANTRMKCRRTLHLNKRYIHTEKATSRVASRPGRTVSCLEQTLSPIQTSRPPRLINLRQSARVDHETALTSSISHHRRRRSRSKVESRILPATSRCLSMNSSLGHSFRTTRQTRSIFCRAKQNRPTHFSVGLHI